MDGEADGTGERGSEPYCQGRTGTSCSRTEDRDVAAVCQQDYEGCEKEDGSDVRQVRRGKKEGDGQDGTHRLRAGQPGCF